MAILKQCLSQEIQDRLGDSLSTPALYENWKKSIVIRIKVTYENSGTNSKQKNNFFYSVKTNAKILEVNRSTNKKSVCICLSKDDMAKQCSSKKKCDVKDCNLRQHS